MNGDGADVARSRDVNDAKWLPSAREATKVQVHVSFIFILTYLSFNELLLVVCLVFARDSPTTLWFS